MPTVVIPSLANPSMRFRLGWNDNAFRTHRAMPSASYFSTMGDGNTAHTADCSVYLLPMVPDLVASCRHALRRAIVEGDKATVEAIGDAMRCNTAMDHDTAVKACKAAMSGKPAYICHKEVVRGEKYANRRDAEPLTPLSEDAGADIQSYYRHRLIAGQYPSILELIAAADIADLDGFPYVLKKLSEDDALPTHGDGSLHQVNRDLRDINRVLDAQRTLEQFTRSYVETAQAAEG